MRVTDAMWSAMVLKDIKTAQERTSRAMSEASSGLRVRSPSDDPTAYALASAQSRQADEAERSIRLSGFGVTRLEATEGALDTIGALLARARELATSGATSTLSASERAAGAREVESLRQSALAAANTRAGNDYVFGGHRSDIPPFDGAGAFVGDASVLDIEVAPGVRLEAGIDARAAFDAGGPNDLFATLDTLKVALDANDPVGARAALGAIDAAHDAVLDARSSTGSRLSAFRIASNAASSTRDLATIRHGDLVEADAVTAFSNLQRAQTALSAAITVASRLPLPSLVNGGR